MRLLLFLGLWVIILIPAAAKSKPQSKPGDGVSIPLTGLSGTHQYASTEASAEQVYQWVKTTFRRLEPIYLAQSNAYAIPLYVGNRRSNVKATLTIAASPAGYTYTVSDVRYQGKSGQSAKAAEIADWHLLMVRHAFEEWLSQTPIARRQP